MKPLELTNAPTVEELITSLQKYDKKSRVWIGGEYNHNRPVAITVVDNSVVITNELPMELKVKQNNKNNETIHVPVRTESNDVIMRCVPQIAKRRVRQTGR